MPFPISRRQVLGLSVVGALGAGAYGLVGAVQRVRDSARRMADT